MHDRVELGQAIRHNHEQSRYGLRNPWVFLSSIMLQRNPAPFAVPVLSQWLMVGIYNIHHSFTKAVLCSQGCKSNILLTCVMCGYTPLWIFHLWSFHHGLKLRSQVTNQTHKLLLSMNLGSAHGSPFLPKMHRLPSVSLIPLPLCRIVVQLLQQRQRDPLWPSLGQNAYSNGP